MEDRSSCLECRNENEEGEEEDMGGKKSSLCGLCFGASSANGGEEEEEWERRRCGRKLRLSDEDWGRWGVGERDVDKKASAFIARFYASRHTDTDHQSIIF